MSAAVCLSPDINSQSVRKNSRLSVSVRSRGFRFRARSQISTSGDNTPQIRAVLSKEAVRMLWPSGLNTALLMPPWWPRRRASSSWPLAASQIRAVLSKRGGDDVVPAGAERRAPDVVLMAGQGAQLLAARGIPDPHRLVFRGGDDAAAVRAKRCVQDATPMAGQRPRA